MGKTENKKSSPVEFYVVMLSSQLFTKNLRRRVRESWTCFPHFHFDFILTFWHFIKMATIALVKECLLALKDRTGSSPHAMNKWIEAEKKVSQSLVTSNELCLEIFTIESLSPNFFRKNCRFLRLPETWRGLQWHHLGPKLPIKHPQPTLWHMWYT